MKQRIIPAEPTPEQIERGLSALNLGMPPSVALRAAFIAMTENCPEVSGEPVGVADCGG